MYDFFKLIRSLDDINSVNIFDFVSISYEDIEDIAFQLVSTVLFVLVRSSPTNNRIIGGNEADPNEFPHQVSVRLNQNHICGGSIITNRHILTAAHCVVFKDNETYPANHFSIRAGTINRIAGGIIIPVKTFEVHPDYVIDNDLAVLELEESLIFSNSIRAIELFEGEVPKNADVLISGWGLTVPNGSNLPIYLQYLRVTAVSKAGSAKEMALYSNSLLWLKHKKGTGACNGDSGGPATYNRKLVGVASFVVRKCATSSPDAYSKVSYNIDWIRGKIA